MMIMRSSSPCWCGRDKTYGECHKPVEEKLKQLKKQKQIVPKKKLIKTVSQIEGIKRAGAANQKVLDYVEKYVKAGVTTEEINARVDEYTRKIGGIPATLGYEGYPKSVCTSINEVVCHGIPDPERELKEGDIVNIDCTTIMDGYFGDASRMYCIGDVSAEKRQLVEATKKCTEIGVAAIKPWGYLGDVGFVIESYAKSLGYSVVREIGGHGCGVQFHEDPFVYHVGRPNTGMILVPGMTLTVEPMINMGGAEVYIDDSDGWTVYTEDGSPSAQVEYMILVTDTGVEIISQ